jgi:muramidase (phage lysozyme)
MTHSNSFESPPQSAEKSSSREIPPTSASMSSGSLGNKGIKKEPPRFQKLRLRHQVVFAGLLGAVLSLQFHLFPSFQREFSEPREVYPPLAMTGGDPYLRALMRTISVSESNDPSPYRVLYGGEHFSDWGSHPDRCIPIVNGPNLGDCTTAAGRYQFISSTWQEKSRLYHPNPEGWPFWQKYTFDPESQDRVVYRWLNDPEAWNLDIRTQLKAGKLRTVLSTLSGTWTSLGDGIETNEMTPYLSEMYQKFLKEEKAKVSLGQP